VSDLATWLDKPSAAARLGISERTLDRLVEKGRPERRMRPRPNTKPEPVYNPDDIEAMAASANPPVAMPPGQTIATTHGTGNAGGLVLASQFAEQFFEKLASATQPQPQQPVRPVPRPWMTIQEASDYSGLSKACLRRLVKEGTLNGILDRSTKVRKVDLDNLDSVATLARSGGGL